MPKEFEPGMRYQGYSQTQGYDPIKPMDVTPLLRENQRTEQSNMQRMLDQSLQVMRIRAQEEQNALQRQNNMLEIFQMIKYRTTKLQPDSYCQPSCLQRL